MAEWTGTWCSQCGPDVSVDEDGCCASCGCSAVGEGAEQVLAWRRERDEARAEVERLKAEHQRTWNKAQRQRENLDGQARSIQKLKERIAALEDKLTRAQIDLYPPGKVSRLARLEESLRWIVAADPDVAASDLVSIAREAIEDKGLPPPEQRAARLEEALRGLLRGTEDCRERGPECGECDWCRARQALDDKGEG